MRHTRTFSFRVAASLLFLLALAPTAARANGFNKEEFAARRAKLFEQIADGVAVVFAGEPHVHPVKFRQSPDFFYLTGVEEPGAVLLLFGPQKQAILFAHKRPEWKVSVEGPGIMNEQNPSEKYGLRVAPAEDMLRLFNFRGTRVQKLYVQLTPPDSLQMGRGEMEGHESELSANPLVRYTPAVRQAVARLRELQPHLQVADISPMLDRLRWVKTPYEIERMRRSGQIGAEGMKAAIRGTRPGMFEYEIEAAARFVQTKMGARGDAFTPIVASGPNTVTFHYTRNDRQMQAGDVVLVDYGADYDYYTSDITRTWPVSGTFTPEQEKMYRCVLEARDAIIAAMKPGATVKQLQDAAEAAYKKHGFQQQFVESGRYVGHTVGLSVHDVGPFAPDTPFEPGVVFNVEPLLTFRDKQIHMRLEDTVLITPTGAENMTAAVPADLPSVYALIKQKGVGQ